MKVGTCPEKTTSGMLSSNASVSPVTALVAPGAGGDQRNAGFAGGAGIAFGGVDRGLFMAHQNMANVVLLKDRIIYG